MPMIPASANSSGVAVSKSTSPKANGQPKVVATSLSQDVQSVKATSSLGSAKSAVTWAVSPGLLPIGKDEEHGEENAKAAKH